MIFFAASRDIFGSLQPLGPPDRCEDVAVCLKSNAVPLILARVDVPLRDA
jgi:hypothetical protein